MQKKTLNITNGDYFSEYFVSRYDGVAIPFCEAMRDGYATADIFSEEFIAQPKGKIAGHPYKGDSISKYQILILILI